MREQATRIVPRRDSALRQICQGIVTGLLFWGSLALIAMLNP